MSNQRETILLDNQNYDKKLHMWNVPILRLPGVKCINIYKNSEEIPSNKYSIQKNIINLFSDIEVDRRYKWSMIAEFDTRNILIRFWLPVILAVITTVGMIAQPILHHFEILYKEKLYYTIDMKEIEYDYKSHEFNIKIYKKPAKALKHVLESELGKWVIYLAVREETTLSDVDQFQYKYFGGPFNLKETVIEKSVKTDKGFTEKLKKTNGLAQCTVILVKKDQEFETTLDLRKFPKDQWKVINHYSVN